MALQVTKYQDSAGGLFDTELEADASNAQIAYKTEVDALVKIHFPARKGARRANPHASTAAKAIFLWIAFKGGSN